MKPDIIKFPIKTDNKIEFREIIFPKTVGFCTEQDIGFKTRDKHFQHGAIKQILSGKFRYYSLSYIVRTSKLKKSDVKNILYSSREFRKATIVSPTGDEAYYLNNRFNRMMHAFESILYLNYIKYIPWTQAQ